MMPRQGLEHLMMYLQKLMDLSLPCIVSNSPSTLPITSNQKFIHAIAHRHVRERWDNRMGFCIYMSKVYVVIELTCLVVLPSTLKKNQDVNE